MIINKLAVLKISNKKEFVEKYCVNVSLTRKFA